jgi:hypothetical protein
MIPIDHSDRQLEVSFWFSFENAAFTGNFNLKSSNWALNTFWTGSTWTGGGGQANYPDAIKQHSWELLLLPVTGIVTIACYNNILVDILQHCSRTKLKKQCLRAQQRSLNTFWTGSTGGQRIQPKILLLGTHNHHCELLPGLGKLSVGLANYQAIKTATTLLALTSVQQHCLAFICARLRMCWVVCQWCSALWLETAHLPCPIDLATTKELLLIPALGRATEVGNTSSTSRCGCMGGASHCISLWQMLSRGIRNKQKMLDCWQLQLWGWAWRRTCQLLMTVLMIERHMLQMMLYNMLCNPVI